MNRPTFLVLGPPRSGSTSLCHYLNQHPDLLVSDPKETRFFDARFEKGMDAYWADHFGGWSGQTAAGDGSPQNLLAPFVPRRIRDELPDARLIVLLRNPVHRIRSGWWQHHVRGFQPRGFLETVNRNLENIRSGQSPLADPSPEYWWEHVAGPGIERRRRHDYPYLEYGHLAQHLTRYREFFPPDQIHLVWFDDFVIDLPGVLGELFTFLGVDPGFVPEDVAPRNTSRSRWSVRLNRMADALGVRRLIPSAVEGTLSTLLRTVVDRGARRPEVPGELQSLLLDYYRPHNQALAALTGRDLSGWDGG